MAEDFNENDLEQDIFSQPEEQRKIDENYNDDSIIHLEDMEHIRRRPGMYIGKGVK